MVIGFCQLGYEGDCGVDRDTLSSSTIQLLYSASQPSWQPRSLTIWLMERCFSPVFVDRSSHWLVLPTPGVPVTIILGWVLGIFEFVVALVELQF